MQYVIKKGDTLSAIARDLTLASTYQDIARYNSIADPNKIFVGQTIMIPDAWLKLSAKIPGQAVVINQPPTTVNVPGNSVSSISESFTSPLTNSPNQTQVTVGAGLLPTGEFLGISLNTWLLIAAGGVAAYLLTRKQ